MEVLTMMRIKMESMASWTPTTMRTVCPPSGRAPIQTQTEIRATRVTAATESQTIWTPMMTETSSLPLWKEARTATVMARPIIVTRMTTASVPF